MKKIMFAVSLAAVLFSTSVFADSSKDTAVSAVSTAGAAAVSGAAALSESASISGATGGSATGGSLTVSAGAVQSSYTNNVEYKEATSTAYAPALTSGSDTCMGSSSVGGQGVGFGFSFGSTWTDKNCIMLKNARLLYGMGQEKVAFALMCQDKSVREASKAAKTNLCPVEEKKGPAESAW